MSILSKAGYEALYGSSGTSLPNNTTEAITPAVVRQWGQDSADSFLFGSSAKVTISSAQILALNSTPQTLVAAGGAGTIIQPLGIAMFLDYNSAAYATNTNLLITMSTFNFTSATTVLTQTADTYYYLAISPSPTNVNIVNQPLQITVQTGNPTAGDSPLYVYVTYRIITL